MNVGHPVTLNVGTNPEVTIQLTGRLSAPYEHFFAGCDIQMLNTVHDDCVDDRVLFSESSSEAKYNGYLAKHGHRYGTRGRIKHVSNSR